MASTVTVLFFSPTGATERIARRLAGALNGETDAVDLSDRAFEGRSFAGDALTVFAAPVFAGRAPAAAIEAIRRCRGEQTPAVAAVVYGNRAFDDAPAELCDLLREQGFAVAAAGAFVAEHSMLRSVAAGRPDARDLAELDAFAAAVLEKLDRSGPAPAEVPGSRPYRNPQAPPPMRPSASQSCVRCGLCAARCPVGAIPADAPGTTRKDCILCMRCVAICPKQARALPAAARAAIRLKLGKLEGVRCPNQTWL